MHSEVMVILRYDEPMPISVEDVKAFIHGQSNTPKPYEILYGEPTIHVPKIDEGTVASLEESGRKLASMLAELREQ